MSGDRDTRTCVGSKLITKTAAHLNVDHAPASQEHLVREQVLDRAQQGTWPVLRALPALPMLPIPSPPILRQ